VPKRPRQSHIPQQATRRRKPRRIFNGAVTADDADIDEAPVYADPPVFNSIGGSDAGGPVETRPWQRTGRRMEMLRGGNQTTSVRVIPGQLPTYERSFLKDELTRIFVTAGSLLLLIIILAIVLR
jgi:hypothetical protein